MKSIRDLLAEHPVFDELLDSDLDLIAGCGRNTRFAAGEVLFEEEQPAEVFYVVRAGKVGLEITAPGRPPVPVATVAAGDVLGWSWLFPPYRWDFTARAREDTAAIEIDGACLRRKCEEDGDLGYRLMKRFARVAVERLTATRLQLLDLYGDGPRPVGP